MNSALDIRAEVAAALTQDRPVVALESTLIAHGLPHPINLRTALESEAAVRETGAVPATIAVLDGRPTVGLTADELQRLATEPGVLKASRRDLAAAIALGKTAATTVSATMALAHLAGIHVFATGGIGGVHRGSPWDVSADLTELARTPVAVVCAGAKSLLDLHSTLEYLETHGVPVLGFGCDEFPAFYLTTSCSRVPHRVDDAVTAAKLITAHWRLDGGGVVIAQPPPRELAIEPALFSQWLAEAESRANFARIAGPSLTPFILKQIAEMSDGRTVELNRSLIVANGRLAGIIAVELANYR